MPLIQSIWKIQFIPESGAPLTLLDFGDLMNEEPSLGSQAEPAANSAIGNIWGRNLALGGAQRPLAWTRRQKHASPAAARAFLLSFPARIPFGSTGSLRYQIQGGETWEVQSCVFQGANPVIVYGAIHTTLTSFSARGSLTRPISEIDLFAGIFPNWINQAPSDISEAPSAL